MPISINTNIHSLFAQRNLNRTNTGMSVALERLSSGYRINSAKDDAAGIAIASRFTAQIRGANQGVRNTSDAISLLQVAEGGLNEISNNLQRIRELAVQSANGTNSSVDRQALQKEVTELTNEITRVVTSTKFNGKSLLNNTESITIISDTNSSSDKIVIDPIDLTEGITPHVNELYADLSDGQGINVTTATNSLSAIQLMDSDINEINTKAAYLGAMQNRFESVIRYTENLSQNLSAARSRIEDADFAKETSNLTKFQILQQAGISVLSQANTLPQLALSLLS